MKPVLRNVTREELQQLIINRVGPLYGAAGGPTHKDREIFELNFRK